MLQSLLEHDRNVSVLNDKGRVAVGLCGVKGYTALIDGGSDICLVSRDVATALHLPLLPTHTVFGGAVMGPVHSNQHMCEVTISFPACDECKYAWSVVVCSDLVVDCIVGRDFLIANYAVYSCLSRPPLLHPAVNTWPENA